MRTHELGMPGRLHQPVRWALAAALWLLLFPLLFADPPNHIDTWKFDVLHLKNGHVLRGLVEEEAATHITFCAIHRRPNQPTTKISSRFDLSEVDHIEKLDAAERDILKARMAKLEPQSEKRRMDALSLKVVPWGKQDKGGFCYSSRFFVLLSDAGEEHVRRAAVRLEDVYTAYASFLPPRRKVDRPTTIRLLRSLAEYREFLKSQGRDLANPGYYDPAANEIVCACGLDELAETLQQKHKENVRLGERLDAQWAEWDKAFKGTIPERLKRQLAADRQKIAEAEEANRDKYKKATNRLFQLLYHEAFHAYLGTFVYPPAEATVPHWLNEGLAQIFETAFVEAGELRVGYPDPKRWDKVRLVLHKDKLCPLRDLLQAGSRPFLVHHADDQEVSDQYYLASWALAYYLTFERKLLGTEELNHYVKALKEGANPLDAFAQLVGQPLGEFEKAESQYLRDLKRDGTLCKPGREREPK
jgi:hypothetical protein